MVAILPIDTGRYGTEEMKEIFREENRLQRMLDVEAALAMAHAKVGNIPERDAEKISRAASTGHVKVEHVKTIEREIKHDIAAIVRALAEQSGSSGAYVHLGATSYDIVDTALALQLRDATELIRERLGTLEGLLLKRAGEFKRSITVGRTHGQHALPTTLGFKFAVWMRGVARNIQRLKQCAERLHVGKMTGAVGTQASLGPHAREIQKLVMQELGLKHAEISTQIVQRDRHAEVICLLALIASSLDNVATEIRELQRPEISEMSESFKREKQVGSSTMPHKRNPEICERICGLAKIVRGLVIPSLENVVTWHERDLTQSSAERFLIPEAFILVDYMLFLMSDVIAGLQVDERRMEQNLGITQGRMMSESVMTALAGKGMNRQHAHELLRKLTLESEAKRQPFVEVLIQNGEIRKLLSDEEVRKSLDPRQYLGTAVAQVEQMIEKTQLERSERRRA